MEVLVARNNGRPYGRLSQSLIVLLGFSVLLGIVAVLHKTSRTHASIEGSLSASSAGSISSSSSAGGNNGFGIIGGSPIGATGNGARLMPAPSVAVPAMYVGSPGDSSTTRPATLLAFAGASDGTIGAGVGAAGNGGRNFSVNVAGNDSAATRPSDAESDGASFTSASAAMAAAKSAEALGDLIEARATLNNALLSGDLTPAEAAPIKQEMARLNQSIVFSPRHFSNDPFGGLYTVNPGETMGHIANLHNTTWQFLSRINGIAPRRLRANATLKVVQGPFYAVVDKKAFTMDLYLGGPGGRGSMYVMTYPVGLGRDDSTPPGTWMVEPHRKIKNPTYFSPRGEGVIDAGDPKNPLGPFWIGLTGIDGQAVGKMSYGIHGTIEPDSIGKQSSMGCIRMHNEDVAIVFELLVEGKSTVIVKE
jgi:lipoprotein-anchoring transpeptidase ErfK/SrfK